MPEQPHLSFHELQTRFLARLRYRIQCGELTERGLARRSGLSQPHIHNLLKGIRALTIETADALLAGARAGVLDLLETSELKAPQSPEPMADVPLLAGCVGPGARWLEGLEPVIMIQFPCRLLTQAALPAAVRVSRDAEMNCGTGIALIDRSLEEPCWPCPNSIYVVVWNGEARLRRIRAGRRGMYLAGDRYLNQPAKWECVPFPKSPGEVVRGRVCASSWTYLREAAASL